MGGVKHVIWHIHKVVFFISAWNFQVYYLDAKKYNNIFHFYTMQWAIDFSEIFLKAMIFNLFLEHSNQEKVGFR